MARFGVLASPLLAAALVVTATACHPRPLTPLAAAAAAGDVSAVQRLVAAGADPEGRDERQGSNALMWAAREGRPLTIRTLVALGARPDATDEGPNRWTPLLHAIHKNHLAAVKILLELGADPNLGAVDGPTPLIAAARYGRTPIVRALLAAGADPRKQSGAVSPLSAAAGGRGGHRPLHHGPVPDGNGPGPARGRARPDNPGRLHQPRRRVLREAAELRGSPEDGGGEEA